MSPFLLRGSGWVRGINKHLTVCVGKTPYMWSLHWVKWKAAAKRNKAHS